MANKDGILDPQPYPPISLTGAPLADVAFGKPMQDLPYELPRLVFAPTWHGGDMSYELSKMQNPAAMQSIFTIGRKSRLSA